MKRREFLSKSALIGSGVLIANSSLASPFTNSRKAKKLVILHTNDTHSNIDAFPLNHPKYPGMGGVLNRFKIIENIRQQEENVLVLDSGDIFQGTPYFNRYKGILEMKLMTKMGYDVATLGNHDFDIGIDGFYNATKYADFPFVNANYDVSKTILNGLILPYVLKKKAGMKIGIFGVGVDLRGLVNEKNWQGIEFLSTVDQANKTAKHLKNQGCDLVICLSHLGYEYKTEKISDILLAKNSSNIDLILGGHTHTFLDKPLYIDNATKKKVLINQVGWAGIYLGRIEIEINSGTIFSKYEIIE